jgi:hypothetical protein
MAKRMPDKELKELWPIGTKIGIKQPYYYIAFRGDLRIRNDNPSNIVLEEVRYVEPPALLKQTGNQFFKKR